MYLCAGERDVYYIYVYTHTYSIRQKDTQTNRLDGEREREEKKKKKKYIYIYRSVDREIHRQRERAGIVWTLLIQCALRSAGLIVDCPEPSHVLVYMAPFL